MIAGWSGLVESATEQMRTDHGLAQAAAESAAFNPLRYGTSYRQGHRRGFWDGIEYVLTTLARWDSLSTGEQVTELGKGIGSIFHPLFADDPRVWGDCPQDGRVTLDRTGICDRCRFDFLKD